jgi:phosphoribosyl-dephospho-CoA transferase
MRFDRHRLVWIDPQRWPAILAAHGLANAPALLADWARDDRPLIARRPVVGELPCLVPLGLPLPPSIGKQRLAFAVPPDAIRADAPPPLLRDAAAAAPPAWQDSIAALVTLDPDTRCFGSLAWAHLTGLAYLSPGSDLDLLWTVADQRTATARARALLTIGATAPMRIDGELLTPQGHAVQWREWASDAPDLLVKAAHANGVTPRASVFA